MANRDTALTIIRKLQANGYEAFLVGGCVRDILLGRDPNDFDVTTNALPNQVQGLFEKTLPVGASFGVIVVLINGEQIEVATYRADGAYTDGRRPDMVEFGKTAKDDVQRRDFTMNGLLLTTPMDFMVKGVTNEDIGMFDGYGIVDFVGGREDIEAKLIRCIGGANVRFAEDALRMVRAVRFAAQLGFDIEEDTFQAIRNNAHLLKHVSRERVAMELFKMFSAPFPLKGLVPFISTGLYLYALPNEDKHVFSKHVDMLHLIRRFGTFAANKDAMLGMGMFFADLDSHFDQRVANYLKLSSDQTRELVYMNSHVLSFRQHLTGTYPLTEAAIKRLLRQPGVTLASEILVQDEIIGKTNLGLEAVMGFVLKLKAYKPEDIKPAPLVGGKDLIDSGVPPSPMFSTLLYDLESMQLNGFLTSKEQGMEFVRARVYQDDDKQWVYAGLTPAERRERGAD